MLLTETPSARDPINLLHILGEHLFKRKEREKGKGKGKREKGKGKREKERKEEMKT